MIEYPKAFAFSVSHTTRKPRNGEEDGREYHFVTREEIMCGIEAGEFLEHTQFSGNYYGTSKSAVQSVLSQDRICALDLDIQGVINLKKTNLDPIFCFIKPPTLESLEKRLRDRGSETEDSLSKRLATAKVELEYEENVKNAFDFVIVNDHLESAYEKLKTILIPQINLVSAKSMNGN
jgi:guanylate kinase